MSIAPEEVAAPAADAVLFRSSPARTFGLLFGILTTACLATAPLAALVTGDSGEPWSSTVLQAGVIAAVVAGVYAISARSALHTWVRISDGGLELAAQDSDPIWLAWDDVESVTIHHTGMRTVLEVVPTEFDGVHAVPGPGPGPGWPTLAETPSGTAFLADLTQVWPGPRALRRELGRRMPPREVPAH
jgi:hypothetical protein